MLSQGQAADRDFAMTKVKRDPDFFHRRKCLHVRIPLVRFGIGFEYSITRRDGMLHDTGIVKNPFVLNPFSSYKVVGYISTKHSVGNFRRLILENSQTNNTPLLYICYTSA